MSEKKLQYIFTKQIKEHPDNPRKDLGDLTELTDSIKACGVLQNLTVVAKPIPNTTPKQYVYTVVIGHRRLAAAKLAGVEKVPCIVVDMDEKEQLRTMLMENMQRQDLTPYEQAQGFQMMIDLGVSIKTLAKDTGFSQATIKKRLEWAKLDKKELEKAAARQISLNDLNKLSNIKDLELRNKALKDMGTRNFESTYQDCVKAEAFADAKAQWLGLLKTFAKEMPEEDRGQTWSKYSYVRNLSKWNVVPLEKPDDADTVEYFYIEKETDVSLYKRKAEDQQQSRVETPEQKAERERTERERAKTEQFDSLAEKHFTMRLDFVDALDPAAEDVKIIWDFVAEHLMEILFSGYMDIDVETFAALFHLDVDEETEYEELPMDDIKDKLLKAPALGVFKMIYAALDQPTTFVEKKWIYQPIEAKGYYFIHKLKASLDSIYEVLEQLGYQLSDEEEALRSGTHPLFDKLPEVKD
jgi:ParB family chromosome partitioning protein